MVAVELPEEEARAALAGFGERLSIAAVNSPAAVVIAGEPAVLDEAVASLQARGITCRRLRVESPNVTQAIKELTCTDCGRRQLVARAADGIVNLVVGIQATSRRERRRPSRTTAVSAPQPSQTSQLVST